MVNLTKGQKISLEKAGASAGNQFTVGLGWDVDESGGAFDLDASVVLLDAENKATGDYDLVFYNNLEHPSHAIVHTGDNRTGAGEGDDEVIKVDLNKLPPQYEHVQFVVTIHEADVRGQNFGQVKNAFIRVVDDATSQELLRFDLSEDFSIETSVLIAEFYRHDGAWKFGAQGVGMKGGLQEICARFGL